jgi:hypothetical protein
MAIEGVGDSIFRRPFAADEVGLGVVAESVGHPLPIAIGKPAGAEKLRLGPPTRMRLVKQIILELPLVDPGEMSLGKHGAAHGADSN